ncbi:hypothetical protein SSX86_020958 [Deinandra increscens subsp. villosa]|uniref:Uncharacterized protein n=1 Tax=Deinandra increscens subsp. villosa TaxID=3103831 RepID=A0AAP0GTX2_9ASTR
MEPENLPKNRPPVVDYSANVDTSRAFRSVKEAVEVFGERFLTGEIFLPSPKPPFTLPKQETSSWKSTQSSQISWKSCSSPRETEESPVLLVNSLKKLESELEETKRELKLLKERESETEVALASLNAELHKNMSKIAKAEAAEKVVALRSSLKDGKSLKKKPIIPLLGDLFSKKKGKSNASSKNQIYTSSQMDWI